MLMKMIELPSDEPVQFVGCYVLKWGRLDEPTVAFVEATDDDILAEMEKRLGNNDEKSCETDENFEL